VSKLSKKCAAAFLFLCFVSCCTGEENLRLPVVFKKLPDKVGLTPSQKARYLHLLRKYLSARTDFLVNNRRSILAARSRIRRATKSGNGKGAAEAQKELDRLMDTLADASERFGTELAKTLTVNQSNRLLKHLRHSPVGWRMREAICRIQPDGKKMPFGGSSSDPTENLKKRKVSARDLDRHVKLSRPALSPWSKPSVPAWSAMPAKARMYNASFLAGVPARLIYRLPNLPGEASSQSLAISREDELKAALSLAFFELRRSSTDR
jgi:hypothetical protein